MTKIERQGVTYLLQPNGTLTCGPLDQSNKLGGTGERDRNETHNPERMHRIKQFHRNPKVLDFGCGSGLFVKFLQNNGVDAWGYDKFGVDGNLVSHHYDVITMVEVIEHTTAPYVELDTVFDCLRPGGILMIETSFTDWMDLQTDPYINPAIGHSTIFSHQGLDELMKEKGFEVYGHINRNVRVYQKPDKPFDPKITLITMGQANPKALKKTLDSFKSLDEFIFGDLLIFDHDREMISEYTQHYPLRLVKLSFNYIFKNGFAATLNQLAEYATNDWILYMNVSEVMDGEHDIKEQMSKAYNCYSFDNANENADALQNARDPHRWFRLFNRKEVKWDGLIHEEVTGNLRPCPFNVFRMKDEEKDLDDPFKAKVANDVKEMVYWNQLMKIVDHPELKGSTNAGWLNYAKEQYDYNNERMKKKGKRVEAFETGNLTMYLEDIYTNPEFEQERFISNESINFQGDRKLL